MRQALSWCCGLSAGFAFAVFLHLLSALGPVELLFSGTLACALVTNWSYELTPLRRAAVRLRIVLRREQPVLSERLARVRQRVVEELRRESTVSDLRRRIELQLATLGKGLVSAAKELSALAGRVVQGLAALGRDPRLEGRFEEESAAPVRQRLNPMWLSYVALVGWALHEIVGVSNYASAPVRTVAAKASSAVDSVASTSAAVVVLGSRLAGDPATTGIPSAVTAAGGVHPEQVLDAPAVTESSRKGNANCKSHGPLGRERHVVCRPGIFERLVESPNRDM